MPPLSFTLKSCVSLLMSKIGFTGTQRGMTVQQKRKLRELLWDYDELHHGDCIGSDDEAHDIALGHGLRIVVHPPSIPTKRAFRTSFHEIRPEQHYNTRNHNIVDETSELIATPAEFEEQLRSGTWATIRYAVKQGKKVTIIFPDGFVRTLRSTR